MNAIRERVASAGSLIWHMPGRAWAGALAAAPWRQWAQALAAFTFTGLLLANMLIIWRGGWGPATETQRLELLGQMSIVLGVLIMLCLLAITDLAVNLSASRSGLNLSAGADDHQGPEQVAKVTTTTTVTAAAPVAPSPSSDPGDLPADQQVPR